MGYVQGINKPGRQPSSCQDFLSNPSSTPRKLPILTSLLSWPQVTLWLLSLAARLNYVAVHEVPFALGALLLELLLKSSGLTSVPSTRLGYSPEAVQKGFFLQPGETER